MNETAEQLCQHWLLCLAFGHIIIADLWAAEELLGPYPPLPKSIGTRAVNGIHAYSISVRAMPFHRLSRCTSKDLYIKEFEVAVLQM